MAFLHGTIFVMIFATLSARLQEECSTECVQRGVSTERSFQLNCNDTCKLQQCHYGCERWKEGHGPLCHDICQSKTRAYQTGSLYCILGCNLAITSYIQNLKNQIGLPAAPVLSAELPTNDSITIQWTKASYDNITYLVQWKSEVFAYFQFRIAWILLPEYTPILSKESVAISTLPYGAPASRPIITRLTAVSPTHISISWNPPLFPNGPVLSYVLYLNEHPKGYSSIKDVNGNLRELYYMFNNLKPQTLYNVSITTRNKFGEGPADVRFIETPPPKRESRDILQPFFILANKGKLLKQKVRFSELSDIVYDTNNPFVIIKGVAIHVKQNLVFISDSSGSVYSISMNDFKNVKTIITRRPTLPEVLSMDWLNNKLYMVEKNQICLGLRNKHKPAQKDIGVYMLTCIHYEWRKDMFLYWINTNGDIAVLHKVDLVLLENGPVWLQNTQKILESKQPIVFTIDYINFRIIISKSNINTVFSLSLDGTDEIDIRKNSQNPMFSNIKSLVLYNNLLFWESGEKVFGEEYNAQNNKYYGNNVYFLMNTGPFSNLNIFHPNIQPYPVPLDPVEDVQVIFDEEIGKISWKKPKLLNILGKGAWQQWLYEVQLLNHINGVKKIETNVSSTSYIFYNLYPNTLYSVKVRAFSPGGKGPWSKEFSGKTLKPGTLGYPYIIWSTGGKLATSNLLGDNISPLILASSFDQVHITDVSWYNQMVFLVTNNSNIHTYNMKSKLLTTLPSFSNVTSIAIDWLAPKLYWSSPLRQMISRANLDGSDPEHFHIITIARELTVDSLSAYIYWATAHSIEFSRLNGVQHEVYFQTSLFSGKYVIGLAIDYDGQSIYWTLRSYEGTTLYKAPLASRIKANIQRYVETIASLEAHDVSGPFGLYSERLFWLKDGQKAIISNLTGQNMAYLKGLESYKLQTLTVVDPSLHYIPGKDRSKINVIPYAIQENQVQVNGLWDRFNITWNLESGVNYGTVYYEMKIETERKSFTFSTEQTFYRFPTDTRLPPYTPIKIEMRAFTFWASSQKTSFVLHSPMSVPSQPVNPRVFISYKRPEPHKNQIDAEFRWKPPVHPNGIILGYFINCWFAHGDHNVSVSSDFKLNGTVLKFQLPDLLPRTTYYFQVSCYTQAGISPPSDIAKADTSVELPVPKLLLAKNDAVKVTDIDTQEEQLLSNKVSPPIDVACLNNEDKVFWIEENGSLMTSNINGTNTILIRNLPQKSTSLTADWITRKLFWTQVEDNVGSIWVLDLNYNGEPISLINKLSFIAAVEVEPFTGHLFWTLINRNGIGQMMISDTNGRNIRPFFSQNDYLYYNRTHRSKREKCNCPVAPRVGSAIAIDYTEKDPKVIWVNGEQGHIWSSDLRGCTCYPLLTALPNKDIGLPPTSIAVDKNKLYWSNSAKGRVYSVPKNIRVSSDPAAQHSQYYDITFEVVGRVRGIRAVADSLQPLPDAECLFPEEYNGIASLRSSTASSFILDLEPATLPSSCQNMSPSSILYTIYYGEYYSDRESCMRNYTFLCLHSKTYNTTITINKLQPFTNYTVRVAISNFYSQQTEIVGPVTVFQTKEGGPIPVRNVRAITVAPNQIDVFWEPPRMVKSGPLRYELRWRSDVKNKSSESAISISRSSLFNKQYNVSLKYLHHGTRYYIVVRTYTNSGDMFSDSYEATATTYQLPSDLVLIKVTSESFLLQWRSPVDIIHTHALEVTRIASKEMFFYKTYQTNSGILYNFTVDNLLSRTQYRARLILTYYPHYVTYIHPQNEKGFIFKTVGDKPGIPGAPFVRKIRAGDYQVIWEGVRRFNDEFLTYELQFSPIGDDDSVLNWKTATNTSSTNWIIEELPVKVTYLFRVGATNEYGSSDYSAVSSKFFLPAPGGFIHPEDEQMVIIFASLLAAVILIVIFLILGLCIAKSQSNKKKTMLQMSIQNHSPHVELATLQELPQNGNFVHENNQLYGLGDAPPDEELTGSQQIRREQIMLTKFLGSGAFGEVFEGIAHELMGEGTPPVRVAVKTLRKGATDQEKAGFLKEAKLMSNFHHDHILRLLGVCLDNNINFIILELMEGGDLLSYLRANRPTVRCASPLTLDDLMSICVHVASGCKYLEEMHFVHRDLAARNCLVSGNDSSNRIVKIGDFGLARDIYKNDYYRKEGEGLLPVRWLSPESLMDGVFTTQSDIWAFGVLLWEVMTLGQQPYPARSNLEVLQYVREGGHLDKPDNCPENFYQLMLMCWNYSPLDRPSFTYCLQRLQELRQTTANRLIPFASVHNHIYCSSVTTDDDSTSILIGENYIDTELSSINTPSLDNSYRHRNAKRINRRRNRRRTFSVNDSSDSLTRTGLECGIWHTSCPQVNMSLPVETVKYLELLPDQGDSSDGYEIPLRLQLKNRQQYGKINTNYPSYSRDHRPYSRDSRSYSSEQSFL
ncbi:proto-oncogene tyrosine-protein kinase ROS-like [Centruroides sculpturatus]|uniref:proto-oncogene tyrosine-protein kinase ROS-like n=1 Tax=Centruroides sculpturatus TaxID=218467 RepID=UPI000C6DEE06|nr:proto-oncogene tyrosine-protein kinase ROS-like [Centruroides sculpturatus]